MASVAIDTNRLFRALKATGKSENFSAEDLVSAFDAAQSEGDWVTRAYFDARISGVDANGAALGMRMDSLEVRMDGLERRMDSLEVRMDGLERRMDSLEVRMDGLERRMTQVEARLERLEARMDVFDAKLDTMRAEIRLDVKSGQLQNLFWLAGIILVSNGALIAMMGRIARLY
ncbi:MAG: hypothetical protein JSS46_15130 [Proteobacteria bacterium]|nr:hypothetical protein [Pseudomonadota bacterium]